MKWAETRSENMVAMNHGRGQIQYIELGLKRDGTIVGLRGRVVCDAGAYPDIGGFLPFLTRSMAQGVYRIPKIQFNSVSAATNTTKTGAYRGAGRPEAAALLERIIDMAAAELEMDPVEIRKQNFLQPDEFPLTTVTGANYDVGEYARALDEAVRVAGYEELRREQAQRRERGDVKQLGVGVSCYVEVTAGGLFQEFGAVEVHEDGSVDRDRRHVGARPGPRDRVPHDRRRDPRRADGIGPDRAVRHRGRAAGDWHDGLAVAADRRQRAVPGERGCPREGEEAGGTPPRGQRRRHRRARGRHRRRRRRAGHRARVGRARAGPPHDDARRPDDMEAGLASELDFNQGEATYPFGAHIAVVEVDTETGRVELIRHVAVDDCGRILNPLLVAGQQHGGIAQGVAQALYEGIVYDDDGNPLTGNLMDYAMPSAAELPSFEASNTETPTPLNPLGAKGIGESGTIGSTPAVQNAVVDALSPYGIRHLDMPLTAERVWRAIQDAKA